MANNRHIKLKLVFLIAIFVFIPFFFIKNFKIDTFLHSLKNHLNTSSISSITINGNHELSLIASSGNGSKSSPYIIKDLIVVGNSSSYGIYFNNTNQYFVLNNCSVTSANTGIYLNNVSNGFINSSRCLNNKKYGIYFNNSISININRSSFSFSNHGIFFYKSYNCSVNYCYFSTNSIGGIILINSDNNQISKNHFYDNNNSGISIQSSDNNIINNNSINNHKIAILLNNSNYNYVKFNMGNGNIENIVEINCFGNLFKNNFIIIRRGNNKPMNIDFTFILIFSIPFIILIIYLFRERSKS